MAKLRHLALQVKNLEETAKFYETVFELKRVTEAKTPLGDAIMLSDGVMNLTLLHFHNEKSAQGKGLGYVGPHHMGFVVDDKKAMLKKIEAAGGKYFMELEAQPGIDAETKCKDPEGIVFDIAEHVWSGSKV